METFALHDLLTPVGIAVVGALLWWRMSRVEGEVLRLRDARHEVNNAVARMEGAVNTLHEVVVGVLRFPK